VSRACLLEVGLLSSCPALPCLGKNWRPGDVPGHCRRKGRRRPSNWLSALCRPDRLVEPTLFPARPHQPTKSPGVCPCQACATAPRHFSWRVIPWNELEQTRQQDSSETRGMECSGEESLDCLLAGASSARNLNLEDLSLEYASDPHWPTLSRTGRGGMSNVTSAASATASLT